MKHAQKDQLFMKGNLIEHVYAIDDTVLYLKDVA